MRKKHFLAVLGYIVATFVTQALSHFVLFKAHYASVSWIKPEPIFALGFASMIIQGLVLSLLYDQSRLASGRILGALVISWSLGAFLVSYIALAEAAKYAVPAVPEWIGVEILAGAVQFTIAGLLLFLAHRGATRQGNSVV